MMSRVINFDFMSMLRVTHLPFRVKDQIHLRSPMIFDYKGYLFTPKEICEYITCLRPANAFKDILGQQATDRKEWRGRRRRRWAQVCAFSSSLDSKSSLLRASYLSIRQPAVGGRGARTFAI